MKEIIDNEITICGSNKPIKLYYRKPSWSKEDEPAFFYRKTEYFLSEFMRIKNAVWNPNPPEWMKEYDGIYNLTAFTGVLIKIVDDEHIKAYTFY